MTVLGDVLVLDLSQNLAGPFCAQLLGDLGAEVIKVEPPATGDPSRAWGPPFWAGESPIFLSGNRNKRSLALDLKTPEGAEAVHRLVEKADVVVQSFRGGAAERLGLGYEDVHAVNPRAVYCSISAFGPRGPLRELPGYDPLMQAYAGLMSVNGNPEGPPARVGFSVVDMSTGLWAALAVMAALRERDASGQGRRVDVSLFEVALNWNAYHLLGYLGTGQVPGPLGSALGMIAPYEAFPTADGEIMIAAGNDALFRRLCIVLDAPALAEDARFSSNAARVAERDMLFEQIASRTLRSATDELEGKLRAAGVPCAPILDVAQVAELPQTRESGVLQEAAHGRIPGYRAVGVPFELAGERPAARRAPPLVGEHTAEVLAELGYTPERIHELEARGVVRTARNAP